MIKIRGKLRMCIAMGIAFTLLLVLYKAVGEGDFTSSYQRLEPAQNNYEKMRASLKRQELILSDVAVSNLPPRYRKRKYQGNDLDSPVTEPYVHQDSMSDHSHKHRSKPSRRKKISSEHVIIKNSNYQKAFDMPNVTPAKPEQSFVAPTEEETSFGGITKSPLTSLFPHKIVHIDLKGAPPKISYYQKVFPVLKKLGVTGLLVEYEDMFPYWGALRNFSAHNAYSKADIFKLQQMAAAYNFEYVPLIQTFGHFEFALKLPDYDHLRETPASPQAICPSKPDSLTLVQTMIDQMMKLHPSINYLHIGCDEVFHLAECAVCHNRMAEYNWGKDDLFLNHSLAVAKYVAETHRIKPIMWDDMFRLMPEWTIVNSNISRYVEIMAWRYNKDILAEFPPSVWEKYIKIFPAIWIASAFKGATGPNQYVTQILHHLENHMAWVQTARNYQPRIQFKGIAITGWQRYDHFAVLCELFPVALPSLAVSLLYLKGYTMANGLLTQATNILDCNHMLTLDFYYTPYMEVISCRYPGGTVFEGVQRLFMLQQEIENALQTNYFKGWIENYNTNWLFSNPDYVMRGLESIDALLYSATNLQNALATSLAEVYDQYAISEWIQTFLTPTLDKLNKMSAAMGRLLEQRNWPRRPLDFNQTQRFSSRDVNSL